MEPLSRAIWWGGGGQPPHTQHHGEGARRLHSAVSVMNEVGTEGMKLGGGRGGPAWPDGTLFYSLAATLTVTNVAVLVIDDVYEQGQLMAHLLTCGLHIYIQLGRPYCIPILFYRASRKFKYKNSFLYPPCCYYIFFLSLCLLLRRWFLICPSFIIYFILMLLLIHRCSKDSAHHGTSDRYDGGSQRSGYP